MKVPVKIPGWYRLDRWAQRHGGEVYCLGFGTDRRRTIFDRITNWTIAQDLRCYELYRRNLTVIDDIEVSEEEYRSWRKLNGCSLPRS